LGRRMIQGLGCMKPADLVDMKSKGLVMQTVQFLLEEVYIPGTRRNLSVGNNHFVQSKCKVQLVKHKCITKELVKTSK
jgi:hypothetical protein